MNNETIRAARSANLVKWLMDNGYNLKKEPKGNYRLPGYGGLIIKDNRWYQFSTKAKGNAIDFLTDFLGMDFKDAVAQLVGQDSILPEFPKSRPAPKQEFVVPAAEKNNRRVIAYLTQKRKLPANLVVSLIRQKLLWQDVMGNCVFPCLNSDNQVVGTILRGTLSDVRWVGTSPGSDVSTGWLMPGEDRTKLIIVESPIEALSLYTLKPELRTHTYLALGGLHWESVRNMVEKDVINEVILALNPDRKQRESWGQIAAAEIESWLRDRGVAVTILLPVREDWNDELISAE